MSSQLTQLQEAAIKQHCKTLRMPMMASQFSTLAEQAVREKKTHTGYLEVLLTAEIEERERNTIERRIKESHLPRVKTLEEDGFRRLSALSRNSGHLLSLFQPLRESLADVFEERAERRQSLVA